MRKLILYIATSMDAYIAKEDGDLAWLSSVERLGEDYGYNDFIGTIDTVIMGRKTYDKVLTFGGDFPHKGRKCYVITRSSPQHTEDVEFYNGDLSALVNSIRSKEGKDIFLDGGAQLVNEFMKLDIIDEYILSTLPLYLGSGIRLYSTGRPLMKMELKSSKVYPSGLVQSRYIRNR